MAAKPGADSLVAEAEKLFCKGKLVDVSYSDAKETDREKAKKVGTKIRKWLQEQYDLGNIEKGLNGKSFSALSKKYPIHISYIFPEVGPVVAPKAKAASASPAVRHLMSALYQSLGNKAFLRDLETLLVEKLTDLSPYDESTLNHLARAIRNG
jgi:hypothetical protein